MTAEVEAETVEENLRAWKWKSEKSSLIMGRGKLMNKVIVNSQALNNNMTVTVAALSKTHELSLRARMLDRWF
jgi:hypothetical protein